MTRIPSTMQPKENDIWEYRYLFSTRPTPLQIGADLIPAYFAGGCQFSSRWIGSVDASSNSVSIRNRPSRVTSYCCLLFPA
jgi:hypothetical protein